LGIRGADDVAGLEQKPSPSWRRTLFTVFSGLTPAAPHPVADKESREGMQVGEARRLHERRLSVVNPDARLSEAGEDESLALLEEARGNRLRVMRMEGQHARSDLKASAGDRLVIHPHHFGEPERDGEILEVIGADGSPPYLVRWSDDGHVSEVFPGPDASVEHFVHGEGG
jgi:hypothetical protein